jgi:hypothetical protein
MVLSSLNKRLLKEYIIFLEYGNTQNPDAQTTSPAKGDPSDPDNKEKQAEKQAQRVDVAVAKNLAGSIKTALPPTVDAATLASAITKVNDQKPLTQPEQMAMTPLNALFTRAAETPQTSSQIGNALRTVANLAKQGKA